jgi:hypothetical protein
MSYDLAVWEGEQPGDDEVAGQTYQYLCETYLEADELLPPTPRLAAFARALLDVYPDIDSDGGDESPWSTAPLSGEAIGPLMSLPMRHSRAEEISAWAAQIAAQHGLVCYDPQMDRLRP